MFVISVFVCTESTEIIFYTTPYMFTLFSEKNMIGKEFILASKLLGKPGPTWPPLRRGPCDRVASLTSPASSEASEGYFYPKLYQRIDPFIRL